MGRLDGQVSVVTGAASGIGRAVFARFVAEGARVVAVDRPGARTDELRSAGSGVAVVAGDVRTAATNVEAVDVAVQRFGRLDVLVANAGIFDGHTLLADIELDVLADAADEMFAVNVVAYLLAARAALEPIVATGGSMIFTSSPAGSHPVGGGILYTASKHAVCGIVRRLAYELAPRVRVNGVAPGGTATDIRGPAALGLAEVPLSGSRARRKADPEGHAGLDAEDHADTYVFLASRIESPATTGQIIDSFGPDGLAALYARPRSAARRTELAP